MAARRLDRVPARVERVTGASVGPRTLSAGPRTTSPSQVASPQANDDAPVDGARRAADQDAIRPAADDPAVAAGAPVGERARSEAQRHEPPLTRSERDVADRLQLLGWLADARRE